MPKSGTTRGLLEMRPAMKQQVPVLSSGDSQALWHMAAADADLVSNLPISTV